MKLCLRAVLILLVQYPLTTARMNTHSKNDIISKYSEFKDYSKVSSALGIPRKQVIIVMVNEHRRLTNQKRKASELKAKEKMIKDGMKYLSLERKNDTMMLERFITNNIATTTALSTLSNMNNSNMTLLEKHLEKSHAERRESLAVMRRIAIPRPRRKATTTITTTLPPMATEVEPDTPLPTEKLGVDKKKKKVASSSPL